MTKETVLVLTREGYSLGPWIKSMEEAGYDVLQSALTHSQSPIQVDLAKVTTVIEWLPYRDSFKKHVLQDLETLLPEDVLVFSSAHDVMAATIASWLQYPQRLVGFSPMSVFRESAIVTLAAPLQAIPETKQRAKDFWHSLQLSLCWIEDTPGLVLPRIYAMLVNEAAFALQEGVATATDIDTAMRLGTNYPDGPLAWADKVGIDTVLGILENLWQVYREERYRPCLLLQKMATAGYLGIKAGQGFFTYAQAEGTVPQEQLQV